MAWVIAAPIGVSASAGSVGGVKLSAVTKSVATRTGPNVTMPTSTRLAAIGSAISSSLNVMRPAFSSLIGFPLIEPDVSSSSRQGQRGSGLSANSETPKGTCWNSLIAVHFLSI